MTEEILLDLHEPQQSGKALKVCLTLPKGESTFNHNTISRWLKIFCSIWRTLTFNHGQVALKVCLILPKYGKTFDSLLLLLSSLSNDFSIIRHFFFLFFLFFYLLLIWRFSRHLSLSLSLSIIFSSIQFYHSEFIFFSYFLFCS